jgi:hypothetical protein
MTAAPRRSSGSHRVTTLVISDDVALILPLNAPLNTKDPQ